MVIDHTHHKRSRSPSHRDEKAAKKPKITDERLKMDALAFQTPHPNIESQSVAYQLPSSSPKPSPGPLSPVPPVPVSKKKERLKHRRSRTGPNATSTPVQRRTDITSPLFTLSSTDHRRELHKDDSSRSASRSSRSSKSTTSSRASSRERGSRNPRLYHRPYASHLKHAKSLGALDGDNSVPSTNTDGVKKYDHGSKNKSTKRRTLDSPYVSRAPSPVQPENAKKAHIFASTVTYQSKRRKQSHMLGPPLALPASGSSPLALTDTYFNANIPSVPRHNHNKKQQYRTQAHDNTSEAHHDNIMNKSKFSSKRKSAKGAENQVLVAGADKSSNLKRRPSAPSALTPPRSQRPPLQPSRLSHGAKAINPTHSNNQVSLKEDVERTNSAANPATNHRPPTGLRPAASMQELHPQGQAKFINDIRRSNQRNFSVMPDRNGAHTAWMHSRAGVDFNRPPSQLDVNIRTNQGDDADWSSSSSEEEDYLLTSEKNRISLGPNFGFGLSNSIELDLDPEVVDPFLYTDNRTDGRPPPSLPGHTLSLDDDAFAKGIRGVSTPSHSQVGKNIINGQNHGRALLRPEPPSFPSLSLQKLSDSPPIGDLQDGPRRTVSRSNSGQLLRPHPRKDIAPDIAHRPSGKAKDKEREAYPDGEEDMELTRGVNSQYFHLDDSHHRSVSSHSAGQEAITWVTDSLISPPTAYIKWKEQEVKNKNDDNGSHPDVLDAESPRSTTSSDSIITSVSHEAPVADNTITDERRPAKNEQEEPEGPAVIARSTTKRTRSGTIMPASPGTISGGGARRTRSGTIIGPIVASAAATAAENGSRLAGGISSLINTVVGTGKTTRSGTIVASASINAMPTTVTDSGIGMSISHGVRPQNRSRSGSMLRTLSNPIFQPMSMQNNTVLPADERSTAAANTVVDPDIVATVQEVGGFVDSVYFPPSSPDELNIIFAPCPEEDEEGLDVLDNEWRVAAEPPSPEAAKKRGKASNGGSSHAILGLAARAASAGRWLKSKSSRAGMSEGGRSGKGLKAHFEPGVGGSGQEDGIEDEPDVLGSTAGITPPSDDELLLVPGATALLFR
ncbi:hypothetical protein D9619_006579 [Psilocybe cf. subviscida]|uniref:Uncharacterized protein n=1 Tax=Psilocybe cf. subviscida TaxID=2480587 RepID=A0A8H5EXK0_9AGAR|nr:hypothetical protein D9619_006579 [Psilocybe cf. subviscida]